MDRQILSEINRMREIMGMSLIMEATGPGMGILDLIFGALGKSGDEFADALGKNVDDISDPIMRDVVEKMKSSVDDMSGQFGTKTSDEVLDDLSAISRGESRTLPGLDTLLSKVESEILNNPALSQKYLDNLIDTYPSINNLVNDSERNSLLKNLKDEFPDRFDDAYNDLINNIESELNSLGVSQNVKNRIIGKIDNNIDTSVQNVVDDFEEQLDELPDTPDPEVPEVKSDAQQFESVRQEFLKEFEGLDAQGVKAYLESQVLPKTIKKIEGKGANLDMRTSIELYYLRLYGLISKKESNDIMNKIVPEWSTIWNSYRTWSQSKELKKAYPSFSKYFLENQKGYLQIPWLKKLTVVAASKAVQLVTYIGKLFVGGEKGSLQTAIITWVAALGTLLGGGYYVLNAAEDITGGQDAGRQSMLTKNNKWKQMFNEFIEDTSEEIETYNEKNELVGEFSVLSSPTENKGITGIDDLDGSIIGWDGVNTNPVIQTKKPLTLNNIPYYYFILEVPKRLGLEKFGTDWGYTLKAYVNNPIKSTPKEPKVITGQYKDELESFKTWYKSRGGDFANADLDNAGKDKNGFYAYNDSKNRFTLNSDASAFDKKQIK